MSDQRSSSGTSGPFAWRCNDERYDGIYGLVTERQVTVDAWRESGISFQPLYALDVAQRAVACGETIAFINRRLEDLAEANALYGKDQGLSAPDKIARNDREISWLKELRGLIATSSVTSTQSEGK